MKFFSFLSKESVHLPPNTKVIPSKIMGHFLKAKEILNKAKVQALDYREDVAKECETLKELAEAAGYEAGFAKWNEQIAYLEEEIRKVRKEMENAIVPLAMTAAKKIVGREIELNSETIVDIVSTALKGVSQHKRITIYVSRSDSEVLEKNRNKIKQLFEHLETLSIQVRDDIDQGGCIIETEAGIINAQLENQWKALENAFYQLLKAKQ